MSLREELDELRATLQRRIPAPQRAVIERALEDVRASGILERVVKVGEEAPDFTLTSTRGREVGLAGLLARRPVVLGFFRGRW